MNYLQLLIDHKPWRLLLNLQILSYDKNGLIALLPTTNGTSLMQTSFLLKPGQSYKLQNEGEGDDELFQQSLIQARLLSKSTTKSGLELAFAF